MVADKEIEKKIKVNRYHTYSLFITKWHQMISRKKKIYNTVLFINFRNYNYIIYYLNFNKTTSNKIISEDVKSN